MEHRSDVWIMFLAGAKFMHLLPPLDCMKIHTIGSRILPCQSYDKFYSFYVNKFAYCHAFEIRKL